MKKLTFWSLVIGLTTLALINIDKDVNAQPIEGWFMAGDQPASYSATLDKKVKKSGKSSAMLQSVERNISGFGTLMQKINAKEYLGKKIRMTSYVKSKGVNQWSGMWMRVDSKVKKKMLSFDNMQDRPIRGDQDWKRCTIILDVPSESAYISYGILLSGTGKVWFDEVSLEVVDDSMQNTGQTVANKTTNPSKKIKPSNLNFDN